ncbi:MAG: excinuclease ABC subunit UvrA [Chloroflexi bacterium]|jgi:excinuclease ABC subunit A|nr:excinuclease ABC subunit UvrA [Chloroflexota bacterium]MBT3671111.1 excinuclease ABC subunit UvrA [Chloroflexota bacterium]MBT4304436.1 excinuclease ABC subunit UvrA [Chloroflexota bacterium]MBT4534904.1 excinuclease ABC subunit UvrA [Chloroflexota bacterium]MBT4684217.1 excinuclease ABC subunit UvrA [Chloroflexota bacterium]
MTEKVIRVVGAKAHNLKNITVEIPRDKFVVITGLSGSGKSSLAFDTIFAEGQRRYVESLSAYARQFLGQMDKPDVEYIEGLSPAVSIDQKATSRNPRSTVGTVTEVYDYLRLLFARVGIPHCPLCGKEVVRQSAQEIVDAVLRLPKGNRLLVLAPIIKHRKGTHQTIFDEINKAGFVRARVDGNVMGLDEKIELDRYKNHTIEAVVDRLVLNLEENEEDKGSFLSRLTDSVETALQFGEGTLTIHDLNNDLDTSFSENLSCPDHDISIPEIEPRTFSFNTPHGACPDCQGIGTKMEIDPNLLIPDKSRSINDGAITAQEWNGPRDFGGYYWQMLVGACEAYDIDMDASFESLTEKQVKVVLYGTDGEEVTVRYRRKSGKLSTFHAAYEGGIPNLERRFKETNSNYMRDRIMQFMNDRPCPTCKGARLRPEALAVTIEGKNILDITEWPVNDTFKWTKSLNGKNSPLKNRDKIIAKRILKELQERLTFMVDVGLEYLTLSRSAGSLSGGEAQRIRLATQIGSRLMGVLYVLDEPSIGLHARDNARLLTTLVGLRDIGNTVLVVEHDDETIRAADWILDLGPGAGEHGGEVVAEGTVKDILNNKKSLTGDYLSGRKKIPLPKERRPGNGKNILVKGARQNNLKNIDVKIPLGRLICITGVSGSGKSSLMNEVLYKSLARNLNRARTIPGDHDGIEGLEHLDKIINIDQSPIGRTPRSNPATYTKLFDEIRKLFTELPESKVRGYKPGRFSFNVKGGRCEACQGQGQIRIEMQFLPDVYVLCEVCSGARFNRETLQVKFKDHNISDILDMPIDRALEFFKAHPSMINKLQTLVDVGLGYIRIGQSAPTLSGGEAQRVKLARYLSKRSTGQTIYVLDEPSVGLHAGDVHKLIVVLQRLVENGNTVVIIEHNMDIIKIADHIIDLGPEGGDRGGKIIAEGTPEEIVKVKKSYTGQYLKSYLGLNGGKKE